MFGIRSCLALVVLLGIAEAVWIPQSLRPECTNCYVVPENNCGTPPSGNYFIKHFRPIYPGNLTYVGNTHMTIRLEYENVYKGEGRLTTFDKDLVGKNVAVEFVGMFDYSSCELFGSYFNINKGIQDIVSWNWDQATMKFEGLCINSNDGHLLYKEESRDTVIFLGTRIMPSPMAPQ